MRKTNKKQNKCLKRNKGRIHYNKNTCMFKFFCKHECLLVLYERNGNVREKVIESMEKYFNKSKNQG